MNVAQVQAGRQSKREQILRFFLANPSVEYCSFELHARWGTAFRTRVSEINRDPQVPITIHNRVAVHSGREESIYWSELRTSASQSPGTKTDVPLTACEPGETLPLLFSEERHVR